MCSDSFGYVLTLLLFSPQNTANLSILPLPSELGDKDRAASVLVCAAKVCSSLILASSVADVNPKLFNVPQYEELLQNADDPEGSHRQAKARATVVYYSSRMEAVSPFRSVKFDSQN